MTDVNPVTETKTSTLPLRGLAMVLIAVAVMLGLWALYAFTRDGGDDVASAPAASSPAASSTAAPAGAAPSPAAPADAAPSPAAPTGAAPAAPEGSAPSPAAPAGAAQGEPALVNVLNNSTVAGLAADTSSRLQADGYHVGEVGNFNEEILTETTVFFPPNDPVAEAQARELAAKYQGVARVNINALPPAPGLTLVLVAQ